MRPSPLDDSRLPEALSDVTEQWSEIAGVDAVVVTVGDRQPLRPEVEVTLLRVAQEALANVEKHAQASRVGVTLSFMDDSVTLDVRDNGVGFDRSAQTRSESYGLSAMGQRIEHLQGELHIESAPGDGTAISASVPADLIGVPHA